MASNGRVRWHIIFSGSVQHVGFRYTAYYIARSLYLTGWVDNLPDGRVEMEAQGGAVQLYKLLQQLKAAPHIRIEHTDIEKRPVLPFERSFQVRGY